MSADATYSFVYSRVVDIFALLLIFNFLFYCMSNDFIGLMGVCQFRILFFFLGIY